MPIARTHPLALRTWQPREAVPAGISLGGARDHDDNAVAGGACLAGTIDKGLQNILLHVEILSLDAPARNTQPRYNICPTTTIDTLIGRMGARALIPMRWGLIPSWWSKPLKEMKLATFNARVETVTDKLMF